MDGRRFAGRRQSKMRGRNFEKGKQYFTEAGCYKCHRFRGDGGNTGPDLTAAGTRFDHKALLESIIELSKVISDQYEASQFILDDVEWSLDAWSI